MKPIHFLFLSSLITISFFACKTKKDAYQLDIRSKRTHYQKLGSNLERIVEMERGLYFYKTRSYEDGTESVWGMNHGDTRAQDTIFSLRTLVGDPLRDGYWVYHYMYSSVLPEEPLYMAWENYQQVSRDTFVKYFYEVDTEPALAFKKLQRSNFHWKDIRPRKYVADYTGEVDTYTFVRETMLRYAGYSNLAKTTNLANAKKYPFRQHTITLSPNLQELHSTLYKDSTKSEKLDADVQSLRIRMSQIPIYKQE